MKEKEYVVTILLLAQHSWRVCMSVCVWVCLYGRVRVFGPRSCDTLVLHCHLVATHEN